MFITQIFGRDGNVQVHYTTIWWGMEGLSSLLKYLVEKGRFMFTTQISDGEGKVQVHYTNS